MPPVKLFISSDFKRDGSFSNFSLQLPRPVDVGKQYRAMVDQIHIPHVFATITANNRALYFEEEDNAQIRDLMIQRMNEAVSEIVNSE